MKMVNIMNYKILLYGIMTLYSIFILQGIDFEKIMRKGKILEIRLLILSLSLIFSYVLTNFILDFLNL